MHPAIPILLMGALVALLEEPQPLPETARERVVLLPDADGRTGEVKVTAAGGAVTLAKAYAGADVFASGKVQARDDTLASIQQRFGPALEARPPQPVSFTLYFVFDQDELTPESLAQFDRIKRELAARPAPEIVVIGHTDRVGAVAYNDALALKRAETVRTALVAAGIDAALIEIAGRGEREPAIATGDEVDEPRNRRVEIVVR
ncbi:MAG: OmpA family protein [Burkholderiales bacterium]|nr:OmpA family protein [Burkholderiales bacterium]